MNDFLQREGETQQSYLGDAVYASFDGYLVWLRTGDGNCNEIALEPAVFNALIRWHKALKDEACA